MAALAAAHTVLLHGGSWCLRAQAVTGCYEASTARFLDLVKQHSVAMLQAAGRYPADLMPPRVVQETLGRLVGAAGDGERDGVVAMVAPQSCVLVSQRTQAFWSACGVFFRS